MKLNIRRLVARGWMQTASGDVLMHNLLENTTLQVPILWAVCMDEVQPPARARSHAPRNSVGRGLGSPLVPRQRDAFGRFPKTWWDDAGWLAACTSDSP